MRPWPLQLFLYEGGLFLAKKTYGWQANERKLAHGLLGQSVVLSLIQYNPAPLIKSVIPVAFKCLFGPECWAAYCITPTSAFVHQHSHHLAAVLQSSFPFRAVAHSLERPQAAGNSVAHKQDISDTQKARYQGEGLI